ncbi:hypothetical protein ENHY17A_50042 [Moraxellaceae bacterium 17A]|nr:hypothetical protein ENHY17A_50042 [Moraxellaceae bacterium 17A]
MATGDYFYGKPEKSSHQLQSVLSLSPVRLLIKFLEATADYDSGFVVL